MVGHGGSYLLREKKNSVKDDSKGVRDGDGQRDSGRRLCIDFIDSFISVCSAVRNISSVIFTTIFSKLYFKNRFEICFTDTFNI